MRMIRMLACLCLAVVLSSCITFDGQTMTYRYDRENDRILIFQVYENICCTGPAVVSTNFPRPKEALPTDTEKTELESVMKGQRTFFFANWIFEYNCEDSVKKIKEMKEDIQKTNCEEKAQMEAAMSLGEQLIPSVAISNGGFYLDSKERLCGYQYVTVANVSKLIPQANKLISQYLQDDLSKTNFIEESNRKQVEDAIKAGNWIQLQGNQLRIAAVSDKDIAEEYRESREKKNDLIGNIVKNVEVRYHRPVAEIIIGRSDQSVTELASPSSSAVKTNLIDFVKQTYGLRKKVPVSRLRDKFLKTGRIPE